MVEDVIVLALLVKRERVLESRAAAAAYPDSQTDLAVGLLLGQESSNLLRRYVCEGDHASETIAMASRLRQKPRRGGAIFVNVPNADQLKARIEDALPGAEVRVEDLTGGGDHFRAEVVSGQFDGLSRIEQHQLVYRRVRRRGGWSDPRPVHQDFDTWRKLT